jgi:hypothetical protein
MSKNNQQLIASYQDVSGEIVAALSPQSTGMRLSDIPAGTADAPIGTQVYLPGAGPLLPFPPDAPSDGDSYQILDADGSCNRLAPVIITPPPGTTIDGGSEYGFAVAFGKVTLTFDASQSNWLVDVGGLPAAALFGAGGTIGGQAVPGNVTPGVAPGVVLWAREVSPVALGLYYVQFTHQAHLSVSDTLTYVISVGGPGGFTGGTADTEDPDFSYEGPTPIVIVPALTQVTTNTSGAGTAQLNTISAFVMVPLAPDSGSSGPLARATIACHVATGAGGTALTLQLLEASIEEQF